MNCTIECSKYCLSGAKLGFRMWGNCTSFINDNVVRTTPYDFDVIILSSKRLINE